MIVDGLFLFRETLDKHDHELDSNPACRFVAPYSNHCTLEPFRHGCDFKKKKRRNRNNGNNGFRQLTSLIVTQTIQREVDEIIEKRSNQSRKLSGDRYPDETNGIDTNRNRKSKCFEPVSPWELGVGGGA